jgi:hypothetical protein
MLRMLKAAPVLGAGAGDGGRGLASMSIGLGLLGLLHTREHL